MEQSGLSLGFLFSDRVGEKASWSGSLDWVKGARATNLARLGGGTI